MTTDTSMVSANVAYLPDGAMGLCYEDIIKQVIEPLPSHLIEVRPGAVTRDKKKAIALAYYDWRIMVNRLNRLVGGRNWYADLQPWGANKLICTLTILGVPKDSSGEGEADDENGGTSAEQQAKKRAMAEHGLNYLYLLPQVWGDYDAEKKRFVNPQALVEQMYHNAHIPELDLLPYITKPAGRRASTKASASTPTGASTREEDATPTELITEKAASIPLVNEKVIQDIRTLCRALGQAEPDSATLTADSAQQLRNRLVNEYKAGRARSTTGPISTP